MYPTMLQYPGTTEVCFTMDINYTEMANKVCPRFHDSARGQRQDYTSNGLSVFFYHYRYGHTFLANSVHPADIGWPTGNGKKPMMQPGTAGLSHRLGCCLVSFHFLWAILRPQSVGNILMSMNAG